MPHISISTHPLSKNEAEDLFSEINGSLEAEFQDESKASIGNQTMNSLPTTDNFDKAEILKCLRILEPNAMVFFQDLQVCGSPFPFE